MHWNLSNIVFPLLSKRMLLAWEHEWRIWTSLVFIRTFFFSIHTSDLAQGIQLSLESGERSGSEESRLVLLAVEKFRKASLTSSSWIFFSLLILIDPTNYLTYLEWGNMVYRFSCHLSNLWGQIELLDIARAVGYFVSFSLTLLIFLEITSCSFAWRFSCYEIFSGTLSLTICDS